MNFDLEARILSARLHLRQSVRRNDMLAKTAIHLEAEKVRDDITKQVKKELNRMALRGFLRYVNSDKRKARE